MSRRKLPKDEKKITVSIKISERELKQLEWGKDEPRSRPISRLIKKELQRRASMSLSENMRHSLGQLSENIGNTMARRKQWLQISTNVNQYLSEIAAHSERRLINYQRNFRGQTMLELSFGSNPTGLVYKKERTEGVFVERGASILFIPQINGKVTVDLIGHSVDYENNNDEQPTRKKINTFEPEHLSIRKNIEELIEKFLDFAIEDHWSFSE